MQVPFLLSLKQARVYCQVVINGLAPHDTAWSGQRRYGGSQQAGIISIQLLLQLPGSNSS